MSHKVLIVEDDDILRDIYALKLEMEGFDVETARDGQEGLEKVDKVKPDLIILDMMMPRVDGMQFLQRYRQDKVAPEAKVLVASNKSSPEQVQEAKRLGATDYLIKSQITPDELVEHIRKHLAKA